MATRYETANQASQQSADREVDELLEKLKELKIRTVEVHPDDGVSAINCLAVQPGRVIMSDAVSARTLDALDRHRITVVARDSVGAVLVSAADPAACRHGSGLRHPDQVEGEPVVEGVTVPAGEELGPFRGREFDVGLGNGQVEIEANDEPVPIPAAADPLGYRITGSGTRELDAGERPTCT